MTDSAPSHASDLAGDLLPRVPIKRARAQLSCTPCRQGKLKCNREQPFCDQCVKRARRDACHYVPPPPRNQQTQNMRGRIRNLEQLVVNLINQKAADKPAGSISEAQQDVDSEAHGQPSSDFFARLDIGHTGTQTYAGSNHWTGILNQITEVKKSLEDHLRGDIDEREEEEWDHLNARSTVTFGIPKPTSKAMLIQELVDVGKKDVDRLLALWFNSVDPLLFIIHAPTFLEEYKQFWKDPSSTPIMWIAMLFSIMALGIIVGPRSQGTPFDDDDHMSSPAHKFQQLASSAMVLADIAKSQPYTLETLMIYGECEFLKRDDRHSKIWLMNGVVLRVAIRMGYHRDPSNFDGISPFHGEMRRRVFHVLSTMDTIISFAIGLPTALRSLESDVENPRNLLDADFSPKITALPKERPHSEITPALYTIVMSRVCKVFGEAHELAGKLKLPQYSYIMALNKRLDAAYDRVPEGLRVRPVEDSITDDPVLIMSRYNIELLYQKTRIVLHRMYLTAGQSDARYAESQRICLEAALELLQCQNTIFHACQPGGQLNKVWWYLSSLCTYDFLLAAMVLCLELHHLRIEDNSSSRIPEWLGILESTREIWANQPPRYRDAVRGAEILKVMIQSTSRDGPRSAGKRALQNDEGQNTAQTTMDFTLQNMSENLSSQIWPGPWRPATDTTTLTNENLQAVDWTLWDSTMQGHHRMIPQQNWTSPGPSNANLDHWMTMGNNPNMYFNDMHDLLDPLFLPVTSDSEYSPVPTQPHWGPQ